MASIRAKLTTAYAGALVGTIALFAVALYTARRASVYRELERHVLAEIEQSRAIIRDAELSGEPLTLVRDTLIGPSVSPRLRTLLEGVPDYVLVLDTSGRTLYNSFAVRQLDPDDQVTLSRVALSLDATGPAIFVDLRQVRLLLAVRRETAPGTAISRVVAGASVRSAVVAPRELVGTILALAPFVLLVSIGGAYFIAGRAFRPVDRIINEVAAITDGRSLHRRLPVDDTGDELARLAATLNAMIGRLEDSFGALRRFTADASHELKTPLTVLRADVERAMTSAQSSTEQLVALEEALHETTRMADLVESLLTLARADEGRFDLHREPVPMEPLAREVLETAVILGEEAGLDVSMPISESGTVMGDRPRLRQLMLNLISNAVKYTPRGGRVELALSRRVDGIGFSVRDTGIGIAAADLPYVFERFWRADRARSRRPTADGTRWTDDRGGFGLGLAISQYIAQAHGGSLTVNSRLGRGSLFTLLLPVDGEDGTALSPPTNSPSPNHSSILTS